MSARREVSTKLSWPLRVTHGSVQGRARRTAHPRLYRPSTSGRPRVSVYLRGCKLKSGKDAAGNQTGGRCAVVVVVVMFFLFF